MRISSPSVEAGAVLRDLLAAFATQGNAPLLPRGIELTQSHRMRQEDANGRNILAVSQAIDAGIQPSFSSRQTDDPTITECAAVNELTFRGVEFLAAPDGSLVQDEFLDRWYADVIQFQSDVHERVREVYELDHGRFSESDQEKLRTCFEYWDRFRILCLTRVSRNTGADRVNAILHQRVMSERNRTTQHDSRFVSGEPIMMQVNDYNRGIFNGDQGLIVDVWQGDRPQPAAVFPRPGGGLAAFHVESLKSVLLHSFAMTVHKAQGSEFDQVALILPDRDLPINTREILYTALTSEPSGCDHRRHARDS